MVDYYVDTDSGNNGNAGTSWGAAKATLAGAVALLSGTLSDAVTIHCKGTAADTTAVVLPASVVSTATNYILITTDAADRHDGKWNTGKYRLEFTNPSPNGIECGSDYVTWRGIQFKLIASADGKRCFEAGDYHAASSRLWIDKCIFIGDITSAYDSMILIEDGDADRPVFLTNCLFYDMKYAAFGDTRILRAAGGNTVTVYNCTFQNNYLGVMQAAGTVLLKNCLFSGNTGDTEGTISTSSDYNATSKANFGAGYTTNTNDRVSQTFTFVNEAGDDFHLASGDAGAKDFGVSDPGSGLYSDDIDGVARSGSWDIGADEYVAAGSTFVPQVIMVL